MSFFSWVEILGYFSELEALHHVIFIGEWPEETNHRLELVSGATAFVCVSSGLVNKCRSLFFCPSGASASGALRQEVAALSCIIVCLCWRLHLFFLFLFFNTLGTNCTLEMRL